MVLQNQSAALTEADLFLRLIGLSQTGSEVEENDLGSAQDPEPELLLSPTAYSLAALFFLSTWILGTTGNFLVIFLVVKNKQVNNIYSLYLSVSSLYRSCSVLPYFRLLDSSVCSRHVS